MEVKETHVFTPEDSWAETAPVTCKAYPTPQANGPQRSSFLDPPTPQAARDAIVPPAIEPEEWADEGGPLPSSFSVSYIDEENGASLLGAAYLAPLPTTDSKVGPTRISSNCPSPLSTSRLSLV